MSYKKHRCAPFATFEHLPAATAVPGSFVSCATPVVAGGAAVRLRRPTHSMKSGTAALVSRSILKHDCFRTTPLRQLIGRWITCQIGFGNCSFSGSWKVCRIERWLTRWVFPSER